MILATAKELRGPRLSKFIGGELGEEVLQDADEEAEKVDGAGEAKDDQ